MKKQISQYKEFKLSNSTKRTIVIVVFYSLAIFAIAFLLTAVLHSIEENITVEVIESKPLKQSEVLEVVVGTKGIRVNGVTVIDFTDDDWDGDDD